MVDISHVDLVREQFELFDNVHVLEDDSDDFRIILRAGQGVHIQLYMPLPHAEWIRKFEDYLHFDQFLHP